MTRHNVAIDDILAAALRGEIVPDHHLFADSGSAAAIVDRIKYHGIAGLLRDVPGAMSDWPDGITRPVNDCAVAQAMRELRHCQIVRELLGDLAAAKVIAILLKGTALAYDLYRVPATRDRADSDILVDPSDLGQTRIIFRRLGFERHSGDGRADDFCLQEVWFRTSDGDTAHYIDLHWQLLNSPALTAVLPVAECAANLITLPRLGADALAMDRVRTLIHTCIHRMLHFTSPYFIDDQTYYGGDRLIWLHDIHLLAVALSQEEWRTLCRLAVTKGVAAACLDGLLTAQRFLSTPLPAAVSRALGAAPPAHGPAAYLRSRQLGRAWLDLRATSGFRRKFAYLRARALPSTAFVRDKYPRLAGLPVPLLYARRVFDFLRARPSRSPEL